MDVKAFARSLRETVVARDYERLAGFYAEDAVAISPLFGEVRGRVAIIETFKKTFETLPDFTFDVTETFADGNRFAFFGIVGATDQDGWFGLPPTGTSFRYRLTIVCTVVDGRIVHEERQYDLTGVVGRLEKARLETELRIASDVQNALLPRVLKSSPHWEVAADSIPSRAIGGDFFEIRDLANGGLAIALGDVEGKGIPAALVGAMLHGMFAADARTDVRPAGTLEKMNVQLAGDSGEGRRVARQKGARFASFVYGVLYPDGRFVYSNAGHLWPALLAGSRVIRLGDGGPILGAFPDARYREAEVRLSAGDRLLLFSDGASEALNAEDEEFGEDRLIACAAGPGESSPTEILARVFRAIREFTGPGTPSDDITLSVTRFR
ncbi:MAG TPA: SpoIIE family protein phosphatase [Thermoanaerobaculia bacterium]|nr:SpoIIE family protein phosphatase [Thermoanaerobaculia bacterium]